MRAGQCGSSRAGLSARSPARGARQQAERRQPLGKAVRIAIEPQRRLEGGEADLVDTQRALHRVAVDARRSDPCAPTMKPACGPPSSLSPVKVTRSAPSATASRDRRLVRQAVAREIDQGAGAEIVDQRHAARSCAIAPVREPATSAVKPSMR